ncbi:carbohydrate ABC transporter permease [Curvibacter sp. CHRR-16]|uniref:carbohydrate ABC transporter permease n=1 Tax=Curvibacter sp. CHRR-16 TaxID=2835872 RepID=UPI001BDA3646|nr:carbohydrate ABC transporter permease [Curvibacter sp. CHRR-16]MBT0569939.1 carbohydrate ABC transporter permease [Curvibacter sp. CHRR-16]
MTTTSRFPSTLPPRTDHAPRARQRWLGRSFDAANVLLLALICLLTVYPFYYVVVASVSEPNALIAHRGLLLWPQGFTLDAFTRVWENPLIRTGFLNTLIIVIGGTALNLVLTCFGAYALSRKRLAVEKPILLLVIFTMYFSGGLIPIYLLVRELGLLNSRLAIILPFAINVWNLLILRTAFNAVPQDFEDAARVDGAGDFTILFRVYVPLCMPTLAVIGLFYAVSHWNGYFYSMVFFQDRSLYPIQLVMREILITNNTESMMLGDVAGREALSNTIKYASIVMATLPILCLYPFLQRFFVKGAMVGGVKE